jgi:hypothetical protein
MNLRIGLMLTILITACESKVDERGLNELILTFDKCLRNDQFDYDSALSQLAAIDKELNEKETRNSKHDYWETTVNYKWNSDSTITLIRSSKKFKKGFRREIMLNFKDSTLITYTFNTEPIGADNKEDYSFMETFEYAKRNKPIRNLTRVAWEQKVLADTMKFRETPFSDVTDLTQKDMFDFAIDYARQVLITN